MSRKDTDGKDEPSVLGALPSTRPNRVGRRSRGAAAAPRGHSGPEAVRAGGPALDPPPADEERPSAPSGTDLVLSVVKAAGEVAHVGVNVSRQVLRGALERLPRP